MSGNTYKINTLELRTCIQELDTLLEEFEEKENSVLSQDAGQSYAWLVEIDAETQEAQVALKKLIECTRAYATMVLSNVEDNDKTSVGGGFR